LVRENNCWRRSNGKTRKLTLSRRKLHYWILEGVLPKEKSPGKENVDYEDAEECLKTAYRQREFTGKAIELKGKNF